jgi:hypothetical protein
VVSRPFARKEANGWGTAQSWHDRHGFTAGSSLDAARNSPKSVDMNFAGTGLHANSGTAAIQFSPDVMVIEGALHHHLVVCCHLA